MQSNKKNEHTSAGCLTLNAATERSTGRGVKHVSLSLDCSSSVVSEPLVAHGYGSYSVEARVKSQPFIEDLTGVIVDIEFGPDKQFHCDLEHTGVANVQRLFSCADGSFSTNSTKLRNRVVMDGQVISALHLGFRITLVGVSAQFLDNNPDVLFDISNTEFSDSSLCEKGTILCTSKSKPSDNIVKIYD